VFAALILPRMLEGMKRKQRSVAANA